MNPRMDNLRDYILKDVNDSASPEEQAKGNHNYMPRLKADSYDLFVEYVVDALKYLKNKGCPLPVALSPQNEPDGGWIVTNDPALKTNFRLMNDLVAFQTETGTFILLVNGSAGPISYHISGLTGKTGTLKTIADNNATTVRTSDFDVTVGTALVTVPRKSVAFIYTKK